MKILSLLAVAAIVFWLCCIPYATSHEWYDWLRRFFGIGICIYVLVRIWYEELLWRAVAVYYIVLWIFKGAPTWLDEENQDPNQPYKTLSRWTMIKQTWNTTRKKYGH